MKFTRQIFLEPARMLRRLYRQSEHYQVRQRAHCILLRNQGYTIEP
ncbi:MAG: hypothetical protein NW220_14065 [Leptolyngbyaceae cyanobacterium bins.349]|nr:hypothetical protein [Leptolyngbyaceae cyanobacterium bins.349]